MAQPSTNLATKHYVSINELSAFPDTRDTKTLDSPKNTALLESLVAKSTIAPFAITGGILAVVLLVTITIALRKARIAGAGLVVVLFALAIPFVTNFLKNGEHTFSKAGPNEVPRSLEVRHKDATSVDITWQTLVPQPGVVKYGKAPLSADNSLSAGNPLDKTTDHIITLSRLENNVTYQIEILSGSIWYGVDGQPVTFTFLSSGPK